MKRNVTRIVTLLLALLMLFSLAACGGQKESGVSGAGASSAPTGSKESGASESDAGKPADDAPKPDTINVALDSDGGTLDPTTLRGATYGALMCIMEPLWDVSTDNEVIFVLAESIDKVSDTQFTVHLRKDVTFSNGNPFTASDVIFTISKFKAGNAFGKVRVQTIDDAATTAIDEYTLDLRLLAPSIANYTVLSQMLVFDEESFDEDKYMSEPIGTGAFKLAEYTPNSVIKLERRDDYWGDAPDFKYLNFRILSETSQRVNALETGLVDIANIATDDVEHVKTLSGYNVQDYYSGNFCNISFNFGTNSFFNQNLDARRAVAHAINPQVILEAVFLGQGEVMSAPVPSYCFDFEDRFNDIDETYAKGYDPDLAKSLAESSGLTGATLRLITDGSAPMIKAAEIIQSMVQSIGVKVEINNYDSATVTQMSYDLESQYDFSVGIAIAPNRRVGDQLLNGVRYTPGLVAPGAFDENEKYLEDAPLCMSTLDEKKLSDTLYDMLSRYEKNVISFALCDRLGFTAVSKTIDENSAVRNTATTSLRYATLKFA